MGTLRFLEREIERQIIVLGMTNVQLSLMSVSVPSLSLAMVASSVLDAVAPSDTVGILGDHSIGVLSFRATGLKDGSLVEPRFLQRLQILLLAACYQRAIDAKIWFRVVSRNSSELADASDLIDVVRDCPARLIPVMVGRAAPERRVSMLRAAFSPVGQSGARSMVGISR